LNINKGKAADAMGGKVEVEEVGGEKETGEAAGEETGEDKREVPKAMDSVFK
jgi:hypothetical protein